MRYDPLTQQQRSERMSRIKSKDTKPEMRVRSMVYGLGYRYRLHSKTLPGHPDLVFRKLKKTIFVHGCFWHQHGCDQYRMPRSKKKFWLPKLHQNVERDLKSQAALKKLGWKVLVVWECEIKKIEKLQRKIQRFLG